MKENQICKHDLMQIVRLVLAGRQLETNLAGLQRQRLLSWAVKVKELF